MRWPWQRSKVDNKPAKQAGAGSARAARSSKGGRNREANPRHPERDDKGCWLPGVSGNPDGPLPKASRITEAIRALGDIELAPGSGWTRNLLLASLYWAAALRGNEHCMDAVLERSDGKVPQVTELTGRDGRPLEISPGPSLQDLMRESEPTPGTAATVMAMGEAGALGANEAGKPADESE